MARVTTFRAYIDLIRKAEEALINLAGQTDPSDRASTLRGIYYGTEWSLDYKIEKSTIRNIGFITYTGGNNPADPRPAIGQKLFDDLQASQSLLDRGRGVDVGHILICLETRASIAMRTLPFPGQGGTGVEIVTWLGDLGGGAANLAYRRVKNPNTSVQSIFHNKSSDYGVTDNIEGDIGGYLVACGSEPGGKPIYRNSQGIAEVLEEYLPISNEKQWQTRAALFALALGAQISPKGITNAASLIDDLTEKLYAFAVWYTATRYVPSGQLYKSKVITACNHMRPAAREVATVFVQSLSQAIVHPHNSFIGVSPYPKPSAESSCDSTLLQSASTDVSAVRKEFDNYKKQLQEFFK